MGLVVRDTRTEGEKKACGGSSKKNCGALGWNLQGSFIAVRVIVKESALRGRVRAPRAEG